MQMELVFLGLFLLFFSHKGQLYMLQPSVNLILFQQLFAQLTWAVEYTDCTSAERKDPPPPANECFGYETKQSDGEVPVMLELWGMQSTPSLPSFPGPLWPGVVSPDRALSMGQIELNCVLMLN